MVTIRKIFVVALTVFGKALGVELQSLGALLLLLGCIAAELTGKPFREVSMSHKILKKLEMYALFVEWGTFWCGLVIFLLNSKMQGVQIFLTACAVVSNVVFMLFLIFVLFRSYLEENSNSPVIQFIVSNCCLSRCSFCVMKDATADLQTSENGVYASKNGLNQKQTSDYISNPIHGVEMSLRVSEQQEQQQHDAATAAAAAAAAAEEEEYLRREFLQYMTDDGDIYYVEVETQESVWELPSDGVVVERGS